jgi:S-adenosylmethionine-dependent methyltransferase
MMAALGMADDTNGGGASMSEAEAAVVVGGKVDLILFHAVVEWMIEPLVALSVLKSCLRPSGVLSCLFYNK